MVLINYDELKKIDENLDKLKISFKHKTPSDRFKRRYIVLKIKFLDKANVKNDGKLTINIVKKLRYLIRDFFGVLNFSLSHFFILKKTIKQLDNTFYFVVKVSNKYVETLKSSLFFFREINNMDVVVQSVYSSGSLNNSIRHIENQSYDSNISK